MQDNSDPYSLLVLALNNPATRERYSTKLNRFLASIELQGSLADRGIDAAIKVKKNSSGKARGCYPKKLAVLQQLSDFEKWKRSVSYGRRWIVESVFSAMKRMFGDYVMARKSQNMVKEMFLKASLYNMFAGMSGMRL